MFNIFPKTISSIVNAVARMVFELAYFEAAVWLFSHYDTEAALFYQGSNFQLPHYINFCAAFEFLNLLYKWYESTANRFHIAKLFSFFFFLHFVDKSSRFILKENLSTMKHLTLQET